MLKSNLARTLLKWLLAIAIVIAVSHLPTKRAGDPAPLPATVQGGESRVRRLADALDRFG